MDDRHSVEVAASPHTTAIHIRDSKTPDGPNLTVSGEAWAAFITPGIQSATTTRTARH
ncbi:DUF397 domain-containing protein [Streptomyces sp. NPDC002814]